MSLHRFRTLGRPVPAGTRPAVALLLLLLLVAAPGPWPGLAAAAPVSAGGADRAWEDRDRDRIDDRLMAVRDGFSRLAVTVLLEAPADAATLERLRGEGLQVRYASRHAPVVAGDVPRSRLADLEADPSVIRIEAQQKVRAVNDVARRATGVTNSSLYPAGVWDLLGLDGAGVVVAVLDTGADNGHECLQGRFVGGYNAFTQAETDPDDGNGHGTHVACTALGHGQSDVFPYGTHAGAAPRAALVDVQVLDAGGSGSDASVLRGIDWVIANRDRDWGVSGYRGIQVMSLSLGGGESDGQDTLSLALNRAAEAGIVPVVAAGNNGRSGFITTPGAADKAITVGAFDDRNTVNRGDDARASFSNCGRRDSDGDGETADEQKPEILAPGVNIVSARHNTADQYASFSGTSMATPHVAGVVALLLQLHPDWDWEDVEAALAGTAFDKGVAGWDACTGWGFLNALDFARWLPEPPQAVFTPSEVSPLSLTDVTFVESSVSQYPLRAWNWTFGDGTFLNLSRRPAGAVHRYAQPGSYNVSLRVVDSQGNESAQTVTLEVRDRPPVALGRVTPSYLVDVPVGFESLSTDPDDTIVSHRWEFGDGATAEGTRVQHAYADPGGYDVTLTVEDGWGATSQAAFRVVVYDPEGVRYRGDAAIVQVPTGSFEPTLRPPDLRWRLLRLDGSPLLVQGRVAADADGVTELRIPLERVRMGGSYLVRAAVAGGESQALPITLQPLAASIGAASAVPATRGILVRAPLEDETGTPVVGSPVAFRIEWDGRTYWARAVTDEAGVASARFRSLAPGPEYPVTVSFGGGRYGQYLPAVSEQTVDS